MNTDANSLIASLLWGAVGMGLFIYGKKQQAMVPLFGGLLLVGISYFIASALYMSLAGVVLVTVIIWMQKQGY